MVIDRKLSCSGQNALLIYSREHFLFSRKVGFLIMKQDNKNNQITMRTTAEQKEFLQKQAQEENRTITAIINIALSEKYPKYKKIIRKELDNDAK
jgi:hypothetical protein